MGEGVRILSPGSKMRDGGLAHRPRGESPKALVQETFGFCLLFEHGLRSAKLIASAPYPFLSALIFCTLQINPLYVLLLGSLLSRLPAQVRPPGDLQLF